MVNEPAEPWLQEYEGLSMIHWGHRQAPVVLLIHGWGYDARVWGSFATRLAADAHVIAVDWLASGSPPNLADEVRHVGKVTDVLPHADAVVAHGLGAAAAADLALRGFTHGLVLVVPYIDGPLPEWEIDITQLSDDSPPESEKFQEYLSVFSSAVEDPDRSRGVERMISVLDDMWPEVSEGLAEEDANLGRLMYEKHLRTTFQSSPPVRSEPYWVDRLREVSVPVLVVWPWGSGGLVDALVARAPRGEWIDTSISIPLWTSEAKSRAMEIVARFLPNPA